MDGKKEEELQTNDVRARRHSMSTKKIFFTINSQPFFQPLVPIHTRR